MPKGAWYDAPQCRKPGTYRVIRRKEKEKDMVFFSPDLKICYSVTRAGTWAWRQ